MTITDFTAYHREYYHSRRAKLIAYLGDACAHCGSRERLEFDHVDPGEKSFDISSNLTISSADVRAELDKCQLLCNPCHRRKTAAENAGWTHGTIYGWMKKKCGCVECSAAKRAYYDKRNAARRVKGGSRRQYGRPSVCGEYITYKRGCRCSECRAANAANVAACKARKKAAA